MCPKVKLFLYTFDFIGIVPQFRILKYDSYKSIFSLIISIIITISSIIFSIYSIIDYLKFNNPSISYLMRYDNESNNTIFLKDTIFMFRVYDYDETDLKFIVYYFSEIIITKLNVEKCQGKNINIKFKDDLEKKYNDRINEYYCISYEHGNLPLFSNPGLIKKEKSYISIFVLNDTCFDNYIEVELITENDIIDHDNKDNPIIASSYFYYGYFECGQYFYIDYRYELLKYETDNGYFFNY